MKRYLSVAAASLLVLASQSALAGNCTVESGLALSVNTAELVFNPTITQQTVTATNRGADPMDVYSSISGRLQFFDYSGCDGVTLGENESCQVVVNFYPSMGGENRQYHKRLVVSGETATGEDSQVVCLTGGN